MNTANVSRLSNINRNIYASAKMTGKKENYYLDFCCQNKTDYFITVQHRHETLPHAGLLNSDTLCMRGCVCVMTTMLPIDLEANHRVSKHPKT